MTSGDLAEALAAKGFELDKRRIQLDEPIKSLGDYEVAAKLVHAGQALKRLRSK